MSGIWWLAWRYVVHHRLKSAILVGGLTLTFVLPLTASLLIRHYDAALTARAEDTPMVLGARGKRFDLVLKALYFQGGAVMPVPLTLVDAVRDSGWADAIPLHLEYTAGAGRYPIVGTSIEYFAFRGLAVADGTLPLRLGQCVLGAHVAEQLGRGPGDHVFSDQESLYDITQTYPLKMEVAGVLAPTNTPDDEAVFVDLKTAWIIAGISHGHQDVSGSADPNIVLHRTDEQVVTSAAIYEYNEVTPENIDSFHVHAAKQDLPASAILVLPHDAKGGTLIKAHYNNEPDGDYQILVARDVVSDLRNFAFRIKRFFDASFALVALATLAFLGLVLLLSARLRQREMQTMSRIGCRRRTSLLLQAAELVILLAVSCVLSVVVAGAVIVAAPRFAGLLQAA